MCRTPIFLLFLAVSAASAAPKLFFADADGDLCSSAFDGSGVAALSGGLGVPGFIDVDHQHLYFSDTAGNRIGRTNLDGSELKILADAGDGVLAPAGIVRVGGGLLIVNDGKIDHFDFVSRTLTTRVDSSLSDPRGIFLSGETLFIADAGDNSVKQVNAAGGLINPVSTIATLGSTIPFDITAGGTSLYVSSNKGILSVSLGGTVTSIYDDLPVSGITEADGTLYFTFERSVWKLPLSTGTAALLNDDTSIPGLGILFGIDTTPIPFIRVPNTAAAEPDGEMTFSVTLNERTSEPVIVDFITSDDSATAPRDYTASSGQVTIPPGADFAKVFVPLVEDNLYEDSERFRLTISNPSFGTISDAVGLGTIGPVSPIDDTLKFSWGQNIGWTNWKPGVTGADALTLRTYLGGMVWNQNVGWLNLGDSQPANGYAYSNTGAGDCGVNVLSDGSLEGFAWGQNIGWVNFEQVLGKPQIDYKSGAMSGYAWGQNVGWINLGTGTGFSVASNLLEYRDEDGDNIADEWELARAAAGGLAASDLSFTGASSDADADGFSDFEEFLADTDPFDGSSRLEFVSGAISDPAFPNNVTLEWTASAARCYDLEESTDLDGFGPRLVGLAGDAPTRRVSFSDPLPIRKFWRVGARLPLSHE